ncbi:MAG: class I SAM-dependent methyltransferase [Rhodobacteraceae bacterium]|jgi:trans-aconitate methyltransferase|uniref:class I SAM-dependent DNA methyltransferase n=1 Tax=Albidovulum sp. TaxID=1872424 RepID=UPI001D2A82C8|nr:class I SAM-dependent methyltransferase [uncultured Defluviimonas sp.]MCB2126921.1 class I SAM-dependent methyltransferase [Paracoccaceae bacterium]MCC0069520.1 class I SAM-dependent methyltransferase [Paracoccaceae bacterium]
MSVDARTLAAYDARAADYAKLFRTRGPDRHLQSFIAALPPGARVLDLGCGPGQASVFLREAGHRPDPVDASVGMVALANDRHAIGARQASFDDIDAVAAYEGVWANFSLLHAPRSALPRHLVALNRALVPGGILHVGMKTGTGEARDALDRLYTFVTGAEMRGLLDGAGFTVTAEEEGMERGLAGTLDPFVILRARA